MIFLSNTSPSISKYGGIQMPNTYDAFGNVISEIENIEVLDIHLENVRYNYSECIGLSLLLYEI